MTDVRDIVYRTVFTHLDQVFTLYSRGVSEETLVGFIEVDDILAVSQEIILSSENQATQNLYIEQMESIKRTYIPMHAVVRIDEMSRKHYDYTIKGELEEPAANVQNIHGGKFIFGDTEEVSS